VPVTTRRTLLPAAAFVLLSSCAHAQPASTTQAVSPERLAFYDALLSLCAHAYEGIVLHAPPTDEAFTGRRLVMHVTECSETEIRIPFHVGEDRSRTWVVRRLGHSLELKHVHRHQDGTESSNTNYGGTTTAHGTPHRQEFPADAVSIAAVPARASQWWFLEHYPGRAFAYGLFREGTGMLYRIEFDLTTVVSPPPPAW
jgi:hypothetical protein